MVFQSAFTGKAAVGGFAGATVMVAMRLGIARGVFFNEFRAQRRGGRGVQGMGIHNDDFVKNLVSCSSCHCLHCMLHLQVHLVC